VIVVFMTLLVDLTYRLLNPRGQVRMTELQATSGDIEAATVAVPRTPAA